MNVWIFLQVILNIAFIACGVLVWARLNRPQKDDPRLSRGLQLLQSKIAILEDLSDRTDTQVKQLSILLEQKGREVQNSIGAAQDQIQKVEVSIQKSLEVSKIFQDKIPHKEIIERQNTIKYVQAARLAHQGLSANEIAQKIDIPRSELDFIVKVNKNKLMFSEEHLPDWAQEEIKSSEVPSLTRDYSKVFDVPTVDAVAAEHHKQIENEFKKAVDSAEAKSFIESENVDKDVIKPVLFRNLDGI